MGQISVESRVRNGLAYAPIIQLLRLIYLVAARYAGIFTCLWPSQGLLLEGQCAIMAWRKNQCNIIVVACSLSVYISDRDKTCQLRDFGLNKLFFWRMPDSAYPAYPTGFLLRPRIPRHARPFACPMTSTCADTLSASGLRNAPGLTPFTWTRDKIRWVCG